MSKHFLSSIEIIDFKCFKKFNAKNFKRINLISGKNNVGKTAFMEAIYINLNSLDIETSTSAMASMPFSRNNLEFITNTYSEKVEKEYLEKNDSIHIESNIIKNKFHIKSQNGKKEYEFVLNDIQYIINSNEFSFNEKNIDNINFIDNFGLSNSELKDYFESVQKLDKEESLYNYINSFDSTILNFKVLGGNKAVCKTVFSDEYRDINEFGDGLKHYISIICCVYACKDGYLFIDEIDNGIHYTQLERLWEIIFTISKEVNCQVFATTHSREMINAYAKVSQKLDEEDISFIELGRNKENEIKAITMNYDRFQTEIKNGNEIRGW